ncbi:MAG: hypothetical protein AAFU64_04735, partial [Bacteroidota bacterium]
PNDEFSEGWKKAFEDAEMEPSPHVWTHLDQRLGAKVGATWPYWLPLVLLFLSVGGFLLYRVANHPEVTSKTSLQSGQELITSSGDKPEKATSAASLDPLTTTSNKTQEGIESPSESRASKKAMAKSSPYGTKQKATANPLSQTSTNKSSSQKNHLPSSLKDRSITPDQPQEKVATINIPPTSLLPEEPGDKALPTLALKEAPSQELAGQVSPRTADFSLLSRQTFQPYPSLLTGLREIATPQKREMPSVQPSRFSLSGAFQYIRYDADLQTSYTQYLNAYVDAHQVNDLSTDEFFNDLQESQQERFSYAVDVKLSYALSNRFWLRGGLEWLQSNSRQTTNAIFTNQVNGEWYAFLGNISLNSLADDNFVRALMNHPLYRSGNPEDLDLSSFNQGTQMEIEKKYTQLNIPLELGFVLKPNGRLRASAYAGTAFNLLLKSSYQNPNIDNSTSFNLGDPSVLRQFYMDARFGLNLDYALSPRWSFELEPNYRRALVSLSKNQNFLQVRPQTFAFRFGLKYKF